MADPLPPMQIEPNCDYPLDREFPIACDVDHEKAYCCKDEANLSDPFDDFVFCDGETCVIGPPGCHMIFPELSVSENDNVEPMYKTALSATAMSPWVKVAFQQYEEASENPDATWATILTMGNLSQPFNDEKCMAMIKNFQYGWGAVNRGNRCRFTILDQKGSTFQEWVERMGINPEGDAVPVQGKYRMKVQFGWYISGGANEDICGQPATPLTKDQDEGGILKITVPAEGFNTAFIICSPVMYFITDWINVHFENGKFIYELEGVDSLVRGQEQIIQRTFGTNKKQMYFTKAVELLGRVSFPPFRAEFKAIDATGKITDMQFFPDDGDPETRTCRKAGPDCTGFDSDCQGWGPYGIWQANSTTPLGVIHEWLKRVFARDLTGKIPSGKTSITANYDPTYKFQPNVKGADPCAECVAALPQYGRMLLWANGIPYCQGNFNDAEINNRMKAVYVVNGGNCSPVLHFAPAFRWHSTAAQKAGGLAVPVGGSNTNVGQIAGAVKAACPIAATPGPRRMQVVAPTDRIMKTRNAVLKTQEATYHHIMTNMVIGAIEADLRVQGDPSFWLCSPFEGYGRSVGIVFINPYFLVHGNSDTDCPVWALNDPDAKETAFKSICNELLTSKGWFVMGVDHQIKDGTYSTTLKLKLIAPGAEILPATNPPTGLGGWAEATPLPYGGQFGCLNRTLVGSTAAGWAFEGTDPDGGEIWVGGGTPCSTNYTFTSDLPPD